MALPFENKMQSFELKGRHLLDTLEYSVSAQQTNPTNFYSYRMLQVGGKALFQIHTVFHFTLMEGM